MKYFFCIPILLLIITVSMISCTNSEASMSEIPQNDLEACHLNGNVKYVFITKQLADEEDGTVLLGLDVESARFEFDKSGKLKEIIFFDTHSNVDYEIHYKYNKDGYLESIEEDHDELKYITHHYYTNDFLDSIVRIGEVTKERWDDIYDENSTETCFINKQINRYIKKNNGIQHFFEEYDLIDSTLCRRDSNFTKCSDEQISYGNKRNRINSDVFTFLERSCQTVPSNSDYSLTNDGLVEKYSTPEGETYLYEYSYGNNNNWESLLIRNNSTNKPEFIVYRTIEYFI